MWNGKHKAVTFSFDDGVTQDIKAIEILNKYNLKSTFNINSSLLGLSGQLNIREQQINHNKVNVKDFKKVYDGHEVAVHTLTHPNLTNLDKDTIIHQVETDRKVLSDLCGYEVVGMAYPCGGVNNDDRVAEIIKNNTGVKYSRTIASTHNFDLQKNLFRFDGSVYYVHVDKLFELGEQFINLETNEDKIFYVWGHTYEMDVKGLITWQQFEEFCKLISNKKDIFYGTNKEVLL